MASKHQKNKAYTRARWTGDPTCPRLLSSKDAAEYLGMSWWTLRDAVLSGGLPYIKTHDGARKWWFSIEDLEAWIEKRRDTYR